MESSSHTILGQDAGHDPPGGTEFRLDRASWVPVLGVASTAAFGGLAVAYPAWALALLAGPFLVLTVGMLLLAKTMPDAADKLELVSILRTGRPIDRTHREATDRPCRDASRGENSRACARIRNGRPARAQLPSTSRED